VNKVKYHPCHLDLFNTDENKEILKIQTEFNDEAITILIDDIPIIATGLRLVNDYTGEIWMVKSRYLNKYAIVIIKELKKLIQYYAEEYQLTRMQTVIKPEHEKWIKGLNFEKEVEMKGFSKEKTYIYRRLFKWE
jgi:hypothetical protein